MKYNLFALVSLFASAASAASAQTTTSARRIVPPQPVLGTRGVPIIYADGLRFRDLNRNKTLDMYEDWRRTPNERAADLVARMSLEEKSGALVHGTAPIPGGPMASGPTYDAAALRAQIHDRHVNSLITRMSVPPNVMATQNNAIQAIAEEERLGIPVTISTDPRHHFQVVGGASVAASGFSQWPEPLGFGALGDANVTRQFAATARDDYRAVGIHMALSPQADLATEPRWSRINGTFGEDASAVSKLVGAYVEGMQGGAKGLTPTGVATVVKHWVGYGASVDGYDGHNYYGRIARFPAGRFADHVVAFYGAFAAGVSAVMPTYDILEDVRIDGKLLEPVGAGFNAQLLGDLLRTKHRFAGMILSDWAITNTCDSSCLTGTPRQSPRSIAMPWGVENLSPVERFAKGMNAGIDQFGGVDEGAPLLQAAKQGLVTEARINEAVARVMALKFQLGLFENPYVDPTAAARVVGNPESHRAAQNVQARSTVILKNSLGAKILPRPGMHVFVSGMDTAVVRANGFSIARSAEESEVALFRIAAPFRGAHPGFFFGSFQHEGDLDFAEGDASIGAIKAAAAKVPTIVVIYLDRPAILTPLPSLAKVLIAEFGSSDAALLDVLTGRVRSEGRLPFELPSSMDEVRAQAPDAPHDTKNPLFRIGFRAGATH